MKRRKWSDKLVERVCLACVSDVKGRMSGFTYRLSPPDDNGWGVWLLEVAPELLELVERGPHDGDGIFDLVDIDLLELPRALTVVESFAYDPGSPDELPHIVLTGNYKKREVTVRVFFQPFDDTEAERVYDAVNNCWREKKGDDDDD